jgi:hypothetical protein
MTNKDDQSTSNVSGLTSPASRAGDIQSASKSAINGDLNDMSGNLNNKNGDMMSGNLNDTSGYDTSVNLNDMSGDLSESTSNLSGSNVMLSDSVTAPESHDSDDIVDTNVPDVMEQMSSSIWGGEGTTNEDKADKAELLVSTKNWCAVKYDE